VREHGGYSVATGVWADVRMDGVGVEVGGVATGGMGAAVGGGAIGGWGSIGGTSGAGAGVSCGAGAGISGAGGFGMGSGTGVGSGVFWAMVALPAKSSAAAKPVIGFMSCSFAYLIAKKRPEAIYVPALVSDEVALHRELPPGNRV
jgi:hypothetical protein